MTKAMPETIKKRSGGGEAVTTVPSLKDSPLFVHSLQKGFEVLRAFSADRRHLSPAEITRLTGLDKSATQRFVYTLYTLGYLRRDEQTKLYSISPRMLEFGYSYLHSDYLVEVAQPFLVEAHEETGETVNLAVPDREDIIIVSRIPSKHVVSVNVHIGLRMPALYSSPGRVICAFMDEDQRQHLLDATKFEAYTRYAVTEPSEMREIVEAARRESFCIARSQFFEGDISAAAPVFDSRGKVVAALSIAAPDTRMTIEDARRDFVPVVLKAAQQTTAALVRL